MWGAIKKAINSNLNKSLDLLIQEKTIEINNKIENNASQKSIVNLDTKVQTGNNLIGVTTDAVGTNTLGSVFAKLNKLLTDWTTTRAGFLDTTISSRASQDTVNNINANVGALVNGRVVKSVQRGLVTPGGGHSPLGISVSTINPDKSIVILNGEWGLWDSSSGDTSWSPYLVDLQSNLLFITGAMSAYTSAKVSWQVIEFY